ncbi:3-oxoacyl-(acyl-carrier-protein) synthase [Gramella sp. Hel_I_59]|uniref:beta-ketoacyl synthase N-terminal-like domain-containing protein n=1 Tax=Gramella sp. Hel_I_59 TaxID=1249978 RepID=UPI001151228B|nr:beta-ketoacyl synthase N-terminal-like domain-containing protein [Gramella sp. Hel_I_59]TQI72167.1 3-oxoacyl-(acyl-carrier-protein) synthase [Gramella sp. Hel_I_59]
MKNPISIDAIASISPLGSTAEEIWNNYLQDSHHFSRRTTTEKSWWVGEIPKDLDNQLMELQQEDSRYRHLDRSVLMAILTGRRLQDEPGYNNSNSGLNIGSSRGATELFEKYHKEFLETGKASTYSSPTTTLGNISSWTAQDLQLEGPEFSHSITCSTGMHSILNAIAWLESGMRDNFIAGGSEAPLTGFTLAQMEAMKIYAQSDDEYPCKSLNMEKQKNSMILSEAAGLLSLSKNPSAKSQAVIRGIGYANEELKHGASLSREGFCLQKSMKMAIKDTSEEIDAIVMHAPGTIGGDLAEVNAVNAIFGDDQPAITSNKWKTGHSFATSGILNIQMAILMIQHQQFITVPFSKFQKKPRQLKNILVNSVGFGGNAVSLLISAN